MAKPLKAYYGRRTYADLSQCAYCNEPFFEAGKWHTLCTSDDLETWVFLACDKCFKEMRIDDDDR